MQDIELIIRQLESQAQLNFALFVICFLLVFIAFQLLEKTPQQQKRKTTIIE